VTDDTAFMRVMMRGLLEPLGFEIAGEAKNGKEAVDLYGKIKPDLVTMDITMPEMDGLEAVKRIKRMDPEAKIIMCSAMGQTQLVLESIRSGASDFVVKPIQKERLQEAVSKLFGSSVSCHQEK
jgi:two-component system chemotaxis response regulator CheY